MEQRIRFAPTRHGRVAYSILGRGRPLIVDVGWLFGMEVTWQDPAYRRFFSDLAGDRMVIRYDKIGTGSSDRDHGPLPLDLEVETVRLLAQHLELERYDLLGMCQGGPLMTALAALHAGPVRRLVIYGSCARGADMATREVRESVLSLVRAHWGFGSRTLADIVIPHGTEAERQRFREQQSGSATPAVAAELLELLYTTDVTACCRESSRRRGLFTGERTGSWSMSWAAGWLLPSRGPI